MNRRHLTILAAALALLPASSVRAQTAAGTSPNAPLPAASSAAAPSAPASSAAAPSAAVPSAAVPSAAVPSEAAPSAPAPSAPAPSAPAPAPEGPSVSMGGDWRMTFYGFVELDWMRDSTQSYYDSFGNLPIMRSDGAPPAYVPLGTIDPARVQYGASHPRTLLSARNSRFGFKLSLPDVEGFKTSGLVEVDFMGNQPWNPYSKQGEVSNPNTPTETAFFSNAALRIRHAYGKTEKDWQRANVSLLYGQYYHLFGNQPYYFPASVAYLGLPNQIFGRSPQIRLTGTLKSDAVNVELSGAVVRPAQADGGQWWPDLQAALRVMVNPWKGVHGSGSGQAALDPLSVGVSFVHRDFNVTAYENNRGDPTIAAKMAEARNIMSYSVDALVPVVPCKSLADRSNGLTLTGSYVNGKGIGDLYTGGLAGGAPFPRPDGTQGPQTGFFGANIDPGIVMFDKDGTMRIVKWISYMGGVQYFLPIAKGRVILSANYTHSQSPNLVQPIARGGDPARTFNQANYYDVNLFIDWTRAVRTGISYQRIDQRFNAAKVDPSPKTIAVDESQHPWEHHNRVHLAMFLFF
jgi:hypothetical protein